MSDLAENKTNTTESSPIDEFMLKEYESIAEVTLDHVWTAMQFKKLEVLPIKAKPARQKQRLEMA